MKIFCANDWEDKKSVVTGFREHQKGIFDAFGRLGALADQPEGADVALFVGPADMYHPIPGAQLNACFTATESDRFPRDQITDDFLKADLVLCPCEHNRVVFQKIHPRVEVCPLGVDPAAFPYHQRSEPAKTEPFRFLFCGNLHPLKGAPKLIDAFNRWLASGSMPRNAELFLKTSILGKRNGRDFRGLAYSIARGREFVPSDEPGETPRIVVDNRYLPVEELRDIYRDAHCFVAPLMGGGWELCLPEAMATGLPLIYTHWSAPVDYADETIAYPLRAGDWRLAPCPWNPGAGNLAHVRIDRLIHMMRRVYQNYPEALERGRRASERMHGEYSWDQAAAKLLTVLIRYCGE